MRDVDGARWCGECPSLPSAAPTLLVHDDRGQLFHVAIPTALNGLLPDAELCILPQTGHDPPAAASAPRWDRVSTPSPGGSAVSVGSLVGLFPKPILNDR